MKSFLTPHERRIIRLYYRLSSIKKVADAVGSSLSTVHHHGYNIRVKTKKTLTEWAYFYAVWLQDMLLNSLDYKSIIPILPEGRFI